jgi:DNA-binding XRE family transcriptional regulator
LTKDKPFFILPSTAQITKGQIMKTFHFKKIKEFREAAGLTQMQLSEKVGVMVQQITAWENTPNDKSITTANLAKIADALGKSTDDFFIEARP